MTYADELLLRQVVPTWLEDDGEPSSQAFYPWRDVDDGCLSVDRGSLTTPLAAFVLFTTPSPAGVGQLSAGVWGLTVAEVDSAGLSAWEDPVAQTPTTLANPAHGLVEFGGLPKNRWKPVGRKLKVSARNRGKLHP